MKARTAVAIAWLLAPAAAAAQATPAPAPKSVCPNDDHVAFHSCAIKAAKTFNPPRTPEGKPDFGGLWRRRAAAHEDLEAHPETIDDSGAPSVVVDPPDGRVPMQPWADARRKENAQKYFHHNAACLLSGVPVTMYMTGLYQFVQTPEYFAVLTEEAHAYRIIPLDGGRHLSKGVQLWQGTSRGRWEGNTLVIDTTNLNGKPWFDQRGRFYTEEAHMVERLTLIDASTIHYTATIEDPNVYTRPFTMAVAFRRNTVVGIELYEEACHEGNASLEHIRTAGYSMYFGLSAREARELKKAWEAKR